MSITRSSPVQVAAFSTTFSQAPKLVSTSWSKISVGPSHVLAIKSNNTLWAWGINTNGQIGDGTTISRSSPVQLGNPGYTWNEAIAGINYSVGLRGDGLLFAWGLNSSGVLGDLNAGTTARSSPIQIGTSSWVAVSAGGTHVVAIRSDKSLWGWGLNTSGQLGTGDFLARSSPVQISTSSWSIVSAGNTHTTAITTNGKLFTWGDNTIGTLGYTTPAQSYFSWTSVAGNSNFTVAIRNDGLLFAWGINTNGQLGDFTTINRSSPVQIGTSSWLMVSSEGFQGCVHAIRSDGTLWGWGLNTNSTLGLGDVISRSSPVQVSGGGSWIKVSTGQVHTIALKADYTLWGWGLNNFGTIGDGTTINRSSPVQIGNSSWTNISVGYRAHYAIRLDGKLFAWGWNSEGQLGLGDTISRSSPVQIGSGNWINIFAYGEGGGSSGFVHAITVDNKLFAWGVGTSGQLGYNDLISRSSPVQIGTNSWVSIRAFAGAYVNPLGIQSDGSLWAWGTKSNLMLGEFSNASYTYSWSQVSAGPSHAAAIRSDGRLYTWGLNSSGQLGNSTTVNTSSPVFITVTTGNAGEYWNRVSVNGLRTVGILSNGTLWAWGSNAGYLLGDNTTVNRSAPVQITSVSESWNNVSAGLSHSLAITSLGKLYAWGNNTTQQLGIGSTDTLRSQPVQIGSSSWSQISSYGNHSLAIDVNNKIYGWGDNTLGQIGIGSSPLQWQTVNTYYTTQIFRNDGIIYAMGLNNGGQLGDGTTVSRSSPVQLLGGGSWSQIVSGYDGTNNGYSIGIKTDGTLYTWGLNRSGILGDSTLAATVTRSSPVQLGTSSWLSVATQNNSAIAIRSDYTMWAWGNNAQGQLGDGTTVSKSSPIQIGTSSWTQVSVGSDSAMAIRLDSTLWTWGQNDKGQLGINAGNLSHCSSPVQVGVGNSYIKIAGSAWKTQYAIRSDYTLWSWGDNQYGELGLNNVDILNRSSPVQVGVGFSYDSISSGFVHAIAKRRDGTIWGFGHNLNGQLGDGTVINRSSPVQVGTSSWVSVSAGYYTTFGITVSAINGLQNIYGWGLNANGQLGTGDTINYSSPVLVGSSQIIQLVSSPTQIGTSSWTSISAGLSNSMAIRSDYKLYTWGDNSQLQSGYITPATALGTGSNPNNNAQSYVRNTDNALIIWGSNASGELGDNTTVNRSSPVQLGLGFGNSQFKKVARAKVATLGYSLGIKTDGTLWSWGNNAGGKLGNSETTNRSSPTQIGTLSNWSDVAAGPSHALAIKSDGSLWGWGLNTNGQAGVLSWAKVSSGSSHTLALRSDGQLYGWGSNTVGQVGDSSTVGSRSSPVQLGTGFSWNNISAGINTSAAIRGDYLLFTWGLNTNGALGLSDTANRSSPTQVGTAFTALSWIQISARDYMAGLTSDNRLFTWGSNTGYQLGNGTTVPRSSPVQVGTSSYTSVSTGGSFMSAIRIDGGLFIWGTNTSGQLGLGDVALRSSPVQLGTSSFSVVSASNNAHTLAVTIDGALFSWGNNTFSQLGLSDTVNRSSPVQVGSSYTKVYAGTNYSLATKADNTVFAWGDGTKGNLGIINPLSWTVISAGIGIHQDYTLWVWGDNTSGQLGISSTQYRSSPVQIGTTSWTYTYSTTSNTFAIKSDGSLWGWGFNAQGQLGLFDTTARSSPVQIGSDTNWSTVVANASGATGHVLAIKTNGTLWSWGSNLLGQLGLGDTATKNSPTQVGTSSWTKVSAGNSYSLAIASNNLLYGWGNNSFGQIKDTGMSFLQIGNALAVRQDGQLWVWGGNGSNGGDAGVLGDGTTVNKSSPVLISGTWKSAVNGSGLGSFNTSAGITAAGILYGWGMNAGGSVGDNTTVSKSNPVQIGSDSDWNTLYTGSGEYKFATKNNSTLYAWGANTSGQLGDGTTVTRSSPVQIAGSWTFITASDTLTLGIKTDATLWSWGTSSNGGLGRNTVVSNSSPIQIGTGSWIAVSAGANSVLAIDINYKLYAWGVNASGELGLGDRVARSSPVQVGNSSWTSIATGNNASAAITSDGKLFTWGGAGGLGDLQTISRSSPIQLGTSSWVVVTSGYFAKHAVTLDRRFFTWTNLGGPNQGDGSTTAKNSPVLTAASSTNLSTTIMPYFSSPVLIGTSSWTQIAAGDFHTLAIRLGGGLFTWGKGDQGQLGSGLTTSRSSPVQVGAGTYNVVSAGNSFSGAITTTGGLFTWGLNSSGQLGSAVTTSRSAPVQVGTSSWTTISASKDGMFGITTANQLYAWGNNNLGQLGLGDTASRSSPVQVGSNIQTLYSNPTQITTGYSLTTNSIYFNGTTDNLIIPNNTAFAFGTVDFTIEGWMYITGTTRYQIFYHHADLSLWNNGVALATDTGPVFGFWYNNLMVITTSINLNTWYHVALTRVGNLHTLYMNGVSVGTYSVATTYAPTTDVGIGGQYNGAVAYQFQGYISNVRVIKGQSLFNGTFTPTTSSLTNNSVGHTGAGAAATITGTVSLLTAQSSTFIDNSGNNFTIATNGNPSILRNNYNTLSAGESNSTLINASGLLFTVGDNTTGQIGDGTTVSKSFIVSIANPTLYDNRSSPAQIGTGSWSQIAAGLNYSIALASDGTLYTWGDNTNGYLGDGTRYTKLSMSQIGTNSYTSISSGGSHTVALRTDLTLYAWGLNNAGQLGDNSTTNRSSPVQVDTGLVTSWNLISAGASHTMGTDATYNLPYGWGLNSSGQLGTNDTINKSTPTQLTLSAGINYSIFFNSTSSYVTANKLSIYDFGTGQFTIEAYIYRTSASNDGFIFFRERGVTVDYSLYVDTAGIPGFSIQRNRTTNKATNFTIALNTWYHIAVTRDISNNITIYVNGVSQVVGSSTLNFNDPSNSVMVLGGDNATSTSTRFYGYISSARIIKGTAIYTSGFYPSTGALTTTSQGATASQVSLLTAQNSTLIDNSTNNTPVVGTNVTITTVNPFGPYYSASFNGTNQYLSLTNNAAFNFGTGDFTIELWVYLNAYASNASQIYDTRPAGTVSSSGYQVIQIRPSGAVSWSGGPVNSGGTVPLATWTHIAVARQGTTTKLFLNGIQVSVSSSDTTSYGVGASRPIIGTDGNVPLANGYSFNGFISNLRVVKGTAVYTGNFTVPTNILRTTQSAMTNIVALTGTETSLLTLQSATIVDNSTNAFTLTNNNSVSVTTAYAPFSVSTAGVNTNWDSIIAGVTSTMGTSNNTLFTWGAGTTGQLGDSTTTTKSAPSTTGVGSIWSVQEKLLSSPVQVGTAKSWSIITTGGSHAIAIATDNSLWSWGVNNIGQFGDNTTVGKSSPTQIAGNTSSYTFITAGVSNTFAIRSNTTLLFGWGQNNTGQIGDSSTVAGRSSPVQVWTGTMTSPLIPIKLSTVSGSSYTQVQAGSAASVIDSTGRLYAWGTNTTGQVGDNTVVSRSSPVQLGGLQFTYINSPVQVGTSSYSQVSAGNSHTLAIDSNSLLYAWGKTPANGDTVTRSSPIQIGTNSWLNVSTGNDLSLATDITQTLYAWGLNTNYQLGSPNFYLNQSVTSPIAIGTLALRQNEASSGGAGNGGFIKNI